VLALERAAKQLQKREEYIATLEAREKERSTAAPSLGADNPKPPAPKGGGDLMDEIGEALKMGRQRNVLDVLAEALPTT